MSEEDRQAKITRLVLADEFERAAAMKPTMEEAGIACRALEEQQLRRPLNREQRRALAKRKLNGLDLSG